MKFRAIKTALDIECPARPVKILSIAMVFYCNERIKKGVQSKRGTLYRLVYEKPKLQFHRSERSFFPKFYAFFGHKIFSNHYFSINLVLKCYYDI